MEFWKELLCFKGKKNSLLQMIEVNWRKPTRDRVGTLSTRSESRDISLGDEHLIDGLSYLVAVTVRRLT